MPERRVVVAAARDNFALSQSGGVGARYGVTPDVIANTYAWFTDEANAKAWVGELPSGDHTIWDLVEGGRIK